MDINELSPSEVFSYFQEICAIPHGSGNTGMIADYCLEFAKLHGLKARKDTSDNVVIFKAGSSGYPYLQGGRNSAPQAFVRHQCTGKKDRRLPTILFHSSV